LQKNEYEVVWIRLRPNLITWPILLITMSQLVPKQLLFDWHAEVW
jgi:hypothetical protein